MISVEIKDEKTKVFLYWYITSQSFIPIDRVNSIKVEAVELLNSNKYQIEIEPKLDNNFIEEIKYKYNGNYYYIYKMN